MTSSDPPLFRDESPVEPDLAPPPNKRPRFFHSSDDEQDSTHSDTRRRRANAPQDEPEVMHLEDDDEVEDRGGEERVPPSPRPSRRRSPAPTRTSDPSWTSKYFGDVIVRGYALASASTFVQLKSGDPVSLVRVKPSAAAIELGKKQAASLKKLENDVVRFRNAKGIDVGRIGKHDAAWLARLMDHDLLTVTGFAAEVPKKFRSGQDMSLVLSISMAKTAFTNPNVSNPASNPTSTSSTANGAKPSMFDLGLKETDKERLLRERKSALNKLFDKTNLQPVVDDVAEGGVSSLPGSSQSKRQLLERMEKRRSGEADDEEEDEMSEIQLNLVYSKATKNDATLPERDPPETFALKLRGYQKQALKWMSSMETGEEEARKSMSMHPLWEKYFFPGSTDVFYYNPYSGDLSLEFPKASTKCRGGILADEMGLGKTIMVASLLHTITPWNSSEPTPQEAGPSSADANAEPTLQPPTLNPSRYILKTQTQSRLASSSSSSKTNLVRKPRLEPGTARATLVVAPMTLLSQWCDELERSSTDKGGLRVLMYYGAGRSSAKGLQEEIDSGVDVVVTSYGILCSDFKKSGLAAEEKEKSKENTKQKQDEAAEKEGANSKGKGKGKENGEKTKGKRKKLQGLFAIEWFRIVLDEAHLIKSRTTLNAKASYALKGARRWALTGTPIVNRLEDLYSLLHYIQLEPWGNFSFFKTFVTVPFQNKDPRAIEVIQVILESILLRREKKMKDRNGQPIVTLPEKRIDIVHLDFTPEERVIYEALYKNAKSKFLGYAAQGSVLQNVTAIFSILMRLRQAVLHPTLVLKRLKENLAAKGVRRSLTDAELEVDLTSGELDEVGIRKMIENYASSKNGGAGSDALQELLAPKEEADPLDSDTECMLCLEPVEIPVYLPRCGHSGCKGCVLSHILDAQETGQEARCSACSSGPLTEREIYEIQNADGSKASQRVAKGKKKSAFSIETVSSSPGSTSSREVLTILDSDESDGEADAKPATPKRAKNGKAKARVDEITLSDSDDDANDSTASDDYMPSPKKTRSVGLKHDSVESGSDAGKGDDGDLGSDSDDDAPATNKAKLLLADGDFRSSTKLEALVKSLQAAKEKDPALKAVVFSQFTGFLDLIERVMNRDGFTNLRLDGAMSQTARQKVVRKFTKSDSSVILLASLKAGGVGLNLIAANHVYLMDAWWNSAVESQAIDRIHRFGQTREVFVTRFLVNKTIDDKMIALQERKTRVIQGALGGNSGKDKKQLAEDLAMIFAD
ncbi:hypothetical protein JCM10212_000703 [Sporobolomyces blumeae]